MPRYSAIAYASYLLKNRLKSKRELIKKLQEKKYSEEDISNCITRLEELGLINDERFAASYATDKLNFSRRGKFRISLELLQKGVDKELIEKAVSKISEQDELEVATQLAQARLKQWSKLDPIAQKRRLSALLQRRGFRPSVITELLKLARY